MVESLIKRLTLWACLLVFTGMGILSWWAWKGFDDTLQSDISQARRTEARSVYQLVGSVRSELFHLDFSFRHGVYNAVLDGRSDWFGVLDSLVTTYRAQAHYPSLLEDLLIVSKTPGGVVTWEGWSTRGWATIPQPAWVVSREVFSSQPDPLIFFENPVWVIELPSKGGFKQAVLVHYNVDLVVDQIVPDLAKNIFGDQPGLGLKYEVAVRHDSSPAWSEGTDLQMPLVPEVHLSEWLQTYLQRFPPRPETDFGRMSPDLPPTGGWTVNVRLVPRGLAAAAEATRTDNILLAAGLMVLLTLGLVLVLWLFLKVYLSALREKSFASLVSHELKTPVAAILSLSENLSAGLVTDHPKVQEYGSLIEEQSRRLAERIANLLALATAESPGVAFSREAFDAEAVVRDAASSRGLPAEIAEGPWIVRGNRTAVRAALDNLVTNALRYGVREGEPPEVTLALSRRYRAGIRWIAVSVADRGPGLTRRELRSVFRPYLRGHQATARQIPGGGVGLSLVKATMKHLGGRVEVHPRPKGGLSFSLWLREGGGA